MTRPHPALVVAFLANGLGGPSFLARLPERQSDLDLSDGALGLALAGLALGALVASPVAGRWVGRVGSRPVLVTSAAAIGLTMWTAGAAPNGPSLFAALALIGGLDAAMDISMNAHGAALERTTGRSMMHGLHAAWSLGALAAAAGAAAAAAGGVSSTAHLAMTGAVIGGAVLATRSALVPDRPRPRDLPHHPVPAGGHRTTRTRPRHARLAGPLGVVAAATVAGAFIEGGTADWSAIQLERLGTSTGVAALGVAAFMAGMIAARLVGDRLTDRLGGATVLRGGMALVVAGLAGGVVIDSPAAFAAGLVLAGAGASGLFPLAFSNAARLPGVASGAGVATVSLAARLGLVVEPVLMGAVAEAAGLRWAYLLIAAVAVVVAVSAPRVTAGPLPREGVGPAVEREG